MSSIKLDLSKFKHLKSDEHSTTLQHYEGHTMTLAHKKLSKANQEQLAALSKLGKQADKPSDQGEAKQDQQAKDPNSVPVKMKDGGGVFDAAMESVDKMADRISGDKPSPPGAKKVPYNPSNVPKYGFDGKGLGYAEGGSVKPMDPTSPVPEEQKAADPVTDSLKFDPSKEYKGPDLKLQYETRVKDLQDSHPEIGDNPTLLHETALKEMALEPDKQKDVHDSKELYDQQQAGIQKQQQELMAKAGFGSQQPQVAATQAAAPEAVQQGPQGVQVPQAAQAGVPSGGGLPGGSDQEGMLQGAYANQMKGIQQNATAVGDLGKQQADILNKNIQAQSLAKASYDEHYQALEKERQDLMADVKAGMVDPNKYWTGDAQGNGSHSKIAAGIGMILAGFNPTNNPNAAINFLNKQMEMNIDAQKANLGQKNTLLAANLRQFGNLKDATDMTRLMQHDMMANQLTQAAATAQSPLAKAAALTAAGKLQEDMAPKFQQFAMRRAMMALGNGAGGPNDGAIQQMIMFKRASGDHAGAKELEEHYVPGVGYSPTQAIPDDVRKQIIMRNNFTKMASDYYTFAKQHSGSLDPKVIAQGKTLGAELQGAYRNATNGGVFKEGEQNFIEKLVPSSPTQFLADMRTLPKIQMLIHSQGQQLDQLKNTYGLPVHGSSNTSQQPQGSEPVKRLDKATGKTALFDPTTKKFLGYEK